MPRLACTQHQQRRETTNSNEFGTETQSQHNFPNFYIFIDELNTQDNRERGGFGGFWDILTTDGTDWCTENTGV